jgi:oxygen-independent coproporphyrinogen-3 oxidase
MMGLRMSDGIDLSIAKYHEAYTYFKQMLKDVTVTKNHLKANNINLLDNILLELV